MESDWNPVFLEIIPYKQTGSYIMKTSDEKDAEVRDAALSALGVMKGRLGESAMTKFLSDLNP